ncbi:hypothetical protein Tcan_16569 [Toxocara canis]|uniref:Uncharacterized protein n=1 Tax=Toxocara canis TaxID=6265 RepID=A0A0B2VIM8_TOXCA|nr:hypothetical protein Tcan_16569 [Toxocara canis]
MTKLEMPANGSGTSSATSAVLVSGGTPTTSRLISPTAMPMKVEEASVAQQSTSGVNILSSAGTRYRLPNASPNQENGSMESDDLGPVSRDRCNTWPLRRPQLDINAQTSPLIHEQIPEEENE